MRERPILMTTENAQKCHDGTKTQTRRIVKYYPSLGEPGDWCHRAMEPEFKRIVGDYSRFCHLGVVGGLLWVREAWAPCHECPYEIYKGQNVKNCPSCDASTSGLRWKPSIHMPRWACRTVLEITGVRVERLQSISDADALAEGVTVRPDAEIAARVAGPPETGARMEFFALWESIHGKGSWVLNPWVWVIEFRKVEVER